MLDINTPCPREYVNYRTQYDPTVGSHGGSLIYIRKDIPHVPIQLNSPLQAVAIQFDLRRKYGLCSVYLPPNEPFPRDDFVDLIRQLPKPFLLVGDVNGRHPLWGDVISNPRGNILASVIENENLNVLNNGEPTHYHSQTGTSSCIDLSFCSSNCNLDFTWKVLDDLHGSDHFPITLDTVDGPPAPRPPRWCTDRADWGKFKELSEIITDAEDCPTVDEGIELVNNKFHSAALGSIPRTSGLFKRRPVPWWSEEIKLLHRATRKSLTRLRRHRTEENLIEYRRNRASDIRSHRR